MSKITKNQFIRLNGRGIKVIQRNTGFTSADSCLYKVMDGFCNQNGYDINLKPYSDGLIIDLSLASKIGLTPTVLYAALIRCARAQFGDDFKNKEFIYTIEHGFRDIKMERRQQEVRFRSLIESSKISIVTKSVPGTNIRRARFVKILE